MLFSDTFGKCPDRERVREKHRETWRKVAIKVPTDQSINQQFGLDLPHPLSIPELSTVSRGNKWHMHEFFMHGPCIKGKIVRAHGEIKEMIYSTVLVLLLSFL